MTPAEPTEPTATQLDEAAAAQFIRDWNTAMIRQPGRTVLVITPTGTLDQETRRQITIAEAAGKTVGYLTLPGHDVHLPEDGAQ
jgi:hypothetical protein